VATVLLKGLCFKLDDVLCSEARITMGLYHKAVGRICRRRGAPAARSLLLHLLEHQEEGRAAEAWKLLYADFPGLARVVSYYDLREIVNSTVPLAITYRGIPELALLLRRAGVLTAVMAGRYDRRQPNKVAALYLESLFDRVIYTDYLAADPSRALVEALVDLRWEWVDRLGEGEIAYVADDPALDFPAARLAGYRTLRLRLPETTHQHDEARAPDQVAEREFTSIPDLVTALCRNFRIDPARILPGEWNYYLKPRPWGPLECHQG
jgi:FMN phosphatase YigB (HAD superfamily)